MPGSESEEVPDPPATIDPRQLGFGRLFEGIRDAVVVGDIDSGRIVLWNAAATAIFGHPVSEAVGEPMEILIPEHLRHAHQSGMERYRASGYGPFIDSHVPLELPALRRDGEEILVELSLSPIPDSPDGKRYVIAIIRDVTERARLSAALEGERLRLERANRALAESNDALEAFTYGVSHDLKEPIRAMDAFLGALVEDHGDSVSPTAADLVARAREANRRLSAIIEGLLEFSRASRSDVSDAAPLRVERVLESDVCRARFQTLLEERGGVLEISPAIPPVIATPASICQVLGNLILNALRHNPGPRPMARVLRGASEDSDRFAEIVVEDNGPGFPAEILRRFASGSLVTPGPRGGFGLAIARRTVERLGGRMWLASAPGGGAAVHFTLPSMPPPDGT